jgi:hypothetical protein
MAMAPDDQQLLWSGGFGDQCGQKLLGVVAHVGMGFPMSLVPLEKSLVLF